MGTEVQREAASCSFTGHTLITTPLVMDTGLSVPAELTIPVCLPNWKSICSLPGYPWPLPDTLQNSVIIWGLPRIGGTTSTAWPSPHSLPAPPRPPQTDKFCGKSTLALPVQHQCPSPKYSIPVSPSPLPSPATPGSEPQCKLLDKAHRSSCHLMKDSLKPKAHHPLSRCTTNHLISKQWLPWMPVTEALLLGHLCPRGDRHHPQHG